MNIWNQAPLVRLLISFIVGIILAIYYPLNFPFYDYCIFCLVFFWGVITVVPHFFVSYKNSWWLGILIHLLFIALGFRLAIHKTMLYDKLYFKQLNVSVNHSLCYLKISEPLKEKEKTLKTTADILAVFDNQKWIPAKGRVLCYFQKDSFSQQLNYGDEIIVNAEFKEIQKPQNPNQFNYKQYLHFHNIYHQVYIKKNRWMYSGKNTANYFIAKALELREYLLSVLKKYNVQDDKFAVGAALLLGYEDKLDSEILSAYSGTGAMHVLSVSGLHVGILFFVFNWMLQFFEKIKYGNIFKAVVLILLLWFYACLTGLSPSVLRAATMFSFIVIAKSFNRQTNIYNTLAASAFVLLLFNPFLITEVGFQLSYLAVIGIVYIQPKIHNWFYFGNRLAENIWTITSVSLAAQIATFPLGLHYFHQFPNYFLLSNLIVIPLSTLIIYSGIALFGFSALPVVGQYIALVFITLLQWLNYAVRFIEQLPFALLKNISIGVIETILIYVIIVFLLQYFHFKKIKILMVTFILLIVFLFLQIIEQQKELHQQKIIVYNVPKVTAIDFIDGKQNYFFADSLFALDENALLFNVKHNWWQSGIDKTLFVTNEKVYSHSFKNTGKFLCFYNKLLFIADNNFSPNDRISKSLKIDFLIVSKNPKLKMKELIELFHPREIIFDSSNSISKVNKWKKECVELNCNYYSVIDSGAFEIDI